MNEFDKSSCCFHGDIPNLLECEGNIFRIHYKVFSHQTKNILLCNEMMKYCIRMEIFLKC